MVKQKIIEIGLFTLQELLNTKPELIGQAIVTNIKPLGVCLGTGKQERNLEVQMGNQQVRIA